MILIGIFSIGMVVGALIMSLGIGGMLNRYPVVNCIYELDNALYQSDSSFTDSSLIDVVQWRCAKQYVDFNTTDYSDLFIFKNNT